MREEFNFDNDTEYALTTCRCVCVCVCSPFESLLVFTIKRFYRVVVVILPAVLWPYTCTIFTIFSFLSFVLFLFYFFLILFFSFEMHTRIFPLVYERTNERRQRSVRSAYTTSTFQTFDKDEVLFAISFRVQLLCSVFLLSVSQFWFP